MLDVLGYFDVPLPPPPPPLVMPRLSRARLDFLRDHQVLGLLLLPAAAMLELALAAAHTLLPDPASSSITWGVADVGISSPVVMGGGADVVVVCELDLTSGRLTISHFTDGGDDGSSGTAGSAAAPASAHVSKAVLNARAHVVRVAADSVMTGRWLLMCALWCGMGQWDA